jgi:transposase
MEETMSRKDRTHYSAEEKVAIVKRHLLDGVPVSDLCDQYKLQPTVFYRWQKQLFENGAAAFSTPQGKNNRKAEEKVEALQRKLALKNEVLSELMEEHIKLKKELGEI